MPGYPRIPQEPADGIIIHLLAAVTILQSVQPYSTHGFIFKNLILQKRKDDWQTEGDFLSWESLEEDRWTLYSKAKWVNLDSGLEDPCREKAQINVLLRNEPNSHNDSMKHCKKL